MHNLRNAVRQLEEDEQFEQAMLRGTQIVRQTPATSGDLDAIMQSLMTTAPPKPVSLNQSKVDRVVDETNKLTFNPVKGMSAKDDIAKNIEPAEKRTTRRKEKRKAV